MTSDTTGRQLRPGTAMRVINPEHMRAGETGEIVEIYCGGPYSVIMTMEDGEDRSFSPEELEEVPAWALK